MSDLTNNTLKAITKVDNGHLWVPARRISDLSAIGTGVQVDALKSEVAKALLSGSDAQSTADQASQGVTDTQTAPQQVTGVSATESPYKTPDGQTLSLVSVDFTPVAGDTHYSSANIYFVGYNGNFNAQLMANASVSPAEFLCETTHEAVEVVVVAVSSFGVEADFATAPSVVVSLDGVVSAPPAPSISQAQVALAHNTGWQFSFNIIGGLEFDQIQSYRIYHSESNVTPVPPNNYYRTIPQPHTNVGEEVVQEVTGDILFYWVSAVNTAGLESVLTPVPFTYIDPGAPPPSITQVITTKTYTPTTLLNGWAANAQAANYEGGGGLGSEVWGTNSSATNPYSNATNAYDGNQSTAATASYSHTHQYAGCIWSFSSPSLPSGATISSASISVLSDVLATSGPVAGHADIWYSLDGGVTWTKLYVSYAQRTKQADTINLSSGQDFSKIQVMAFLDSHDDIQQDVYEISLSITMVTNPGPEKVTGVTAALVGGDVQISWNGLVPLSRTDITSYQVYRALHGAGYVNSHLQTSVTPTGVSTYSWTDTEAHDGSWDYWVIAQNSTGYSPASDTANVQSATSVIYTNGSTLESLQPAESGAEKTTGKSIDVLVDGVTYARTAKSGLNSSGGVDLSGGVHTGKTLDNISDGTGRYASAESGSDSTTNHIAAAGGTFPTTAQTIAPGATLTVCTIPITVQSTADIVIVSSSLSIGYPANIAAWVGSIYIDGSTLVSGISGNGWNYTANFPAALVGFITGQAAGSHTITIVVRNADSSTSLTMEANGSSIYALQVIGIGAGFIAAPSGGTLLVKPQIQPA